MRKPPFFLRTASDVVENGAALSAELVQSGVEPADGLLAGGQALAVDQREHTGQDGRRGRGTGADVHLSGHSDPVERVKHTANKKKHELFTGSCGPLEIACESEKRNNAKTKEKTQLRARSG